MDYKKLSRVVDATTKNSGWVEVIAGINGTPCGVVNKEHTQFRPYVGPYFDGYDFYDKYKDWPFEDSEEAKRGLEELAKSWGVDVSDIKTGANDSWEGGYAYVEKKDLGKAIDIDPSEVEVEDGELWFTFDEDDDHDAVIDVYERLPEGDYWWWPNVNDQ